MKRFRRIVRYGPAFVLTLAFLVIPIGGYVSWVTGYLFLFIIQGYVAWLLFVKAGQAFYGYSATMTIGAYTSVVLGRYAELSPVVGILLGGVVAAIVASVFFLSTSRAKGFYAGMASFLLAILVPKVIEGLTSVTGGRSGVMVGGLNLSWGNTTYLIVLIVATVVIVAFVIWLANTRAGRILTLVAENEPLAEATGIRSFNYKLLAYAIAGLLSGLGGGLYLNYIGSISSVDITVFTSVLIFFIPILGSRRSLYGPIVGALFIILIPELFSSVERYLDLLFGVAYILVMVFLPDGIIVGVGDLIAGLRSRIARPREVETTVSS